MKDIVKNSQIYSLFSGSQTFMPYVSFRELRAKSVPLIIFCSCKSYE